MYPRATSLRARARATSPRAINPSTIANLPLTNLRLLVFRYRSSFCALLCICVHSFRSRTNSGQTLTAGKLIRVAGTLAIHGRTEATTNAHATDCRCVHSFLRMSCFSFAPFLLVYLLRRKQLLNIANIQSRVALAFLGPNMYMVCVAPFHCAHVFLLSMFRLEQVRMRSPRMSHMNSKQTVGQG